MPLVGEPAYLLPLTSYLYLLPSAMPTPLVVQPGSSVNLAHVDTRADGGLERSAAKEQLEAYQRELDELQELLYAADDHALLVVLQGMDTSGKDGVIRSVFSRVSPLGCSVASFKPPTSTELAHDFLWRVHQATPPRGHITIFNRSHYEDVVVVRVKELVPEATWRARYEHINGFERLLVESNTIVLKFFLHVSPEEQEERLRKREEDMRKAWKLDPDDWRERRRWSDYMKAYEEAFARCSTEWAPWHIVPSDRKWYRDLVVAETIVGTLRTYRDAWLAKLSRMGEARKAELAAVRSKGT